MKIEVQGLDEEAVCELGAELAAAGGALTAAGAGGTHALVPLDFSSEDLVTRDAEAVTVFWVVSGLGREYRASADLAAAGGALTVAGAGGTHALVPLDFSAEDLGTRDAVPVTVLGGE